MNDALERKTLEAVRRLGVARPRDLTRLGLPREYVQRLADRGALVRVARGLYADPDAPISAQGSLAEVARAVPKGTVCLLSALKFHRLTTHAPPKVWIALGVHALEASEHAISGANGLFLRCCADRRRGNAQDRRRAGANSFAG